MPAPSLEDLRRYAIARSLFAPTTLRQAIDRLGFVQADPIRAPARAQDLTLRQRVRDYRAGDLERRYARLPVEEDCLVNYGFVPRATLALLHPRTVPHPWKPVIRRRAMDVLDFVRERGPTHPKDVLAAFAHHGRVANYWGGTLNASTQLLDAMHYRGLLRVVRREAGTRIYAAAEHPAVDDSPAGRAQRARALVDLIVHKYAPLPAASLTYLVRLLRYGAPHLEHEAQAALREAKTQLPSAVVEGTTWFWPDGENPSSRRGRTDDRVRLLAPFDPVVWDRRRFELLWGWTYKFEAYTPAPQRRLGYYALPLLRGEHVIGWANLSMADGRLRSSFGFSAGQRPRDAAAFGRELDEELGRMEVFLSLQA
jgi:uncharacterized protein YcaQ